MLFALKESCLSSVIHPMKHKLTLASDRRQSELFGLWVVLDLGEWDFLYGNCMVQVYLD